MLRCMLQLSSLSMEQARAANPREALKWLRAMAAGQTKGLAALPVSGLAPHEVGTQRKQRVIKQDAQDWVRTQAPPHVA